MVDKIFCGRINGNCPHEISKTEKTSFVITSYEELHSKEIEKMLKNAISSAFKLKPIVAKQIRSLGSSDMYCTRVCKPIQECTQCVADLTYKNTNVGFEIGVAQSFQKPVIITRYMPNTNPLTKTERTNIKKLMKKGTIQYSEMPIDVPADINAILRVEYRNETELKRKLKEGFRIS